MFGNHYSFDQDVCLRNDSSQLAGFSQSQGKSPDYFVNVARTLRVDSGNNKNSASVLVGPVRSTLDNQSERSPGDYEDASLKFKQLKPHDHLMQSNELSGTNTVQQNKDTRHSQSNEIDLVLGKNLIEDVLEQNEPKEGDQKEGQQERVSPEAINNLPQNNQSRQARVLNQTKTVHSDNISLLEAFNSINEPKL